MNKGEINYEVVMKIQVKATYKNENKSGIIRISKIVGNKPIEYNLQLFENAFIKLKKSRFTSMQLAISHASLYGYIPTIWVVEETNANVLTETEI